MDINGKFEPVFNTRKFIYKWGIAHCRVGKAGTVLDIFDGENQWFGIVLRHPHSGRMRNRIKRYQR